MVQSLNLILLTSAEAVELRMILKQGVRTPEGSALFQTICARPCEPSHPT